MKEYFRFDLLSCLKLSKVGYGVLKYLVDFFIKLYLNIFNIYYEIEKNNYFLLKFLSERNIFV